MSSDDLLPDVDEETLRTFHEYLSRHLRFPVEARWEPEYGPRGPVTILDLSDPDEEIWADGKCGLLCRANHNGEVIEVSLADCEAKKGSPGRQLLADYGYWFGNFG